MEYFQPVPLSAAGFAAAAAGFAAVSFFAVPDESELDALPPELHDANVAAPINSNKIFFMMFGFLIVF